MPSAPMLHSASSPMAGLAVGLALAYLVCLLQKMGGQPPVSWQIMLQGGILGLIVGYATQSWRRAAHTREQVSGSM